MVAGACRASIVSFLPWPGPTAAAPPGSLRSPAGRSRWRSAPTPPWPPPSCRSPGPPSPGSPCRCRADRRITICVGLTRCCGSRSALQAPDDEFCQMGAQFFRKLAHPRQRQGHELREYSDRIAALNRKSRVQSGRSPRKTRSRVPSGTESNDVGFIRRRVRPGTTRTAVQR